MPGGWITVDSASRHDSERKTDLSATLTSISTVMRYTFCRPLDCCGCGGARLPLIPRAETGGSLLAAAVMHARSSTESPCAKAQVGISASNIIRKRMPMSNQPL